MYIIYIIIKNLESERHIKTIKKKKSVENVLPNLTDMYKTSIRHSIDSISYSSNNDTKKKNNSIGSIGTDSSRRFLSSKSNESSTPQSLPINSTTAALAVKMVKKTISQKDLFLKRKVTKSQRKEKRATKTLGIVVGKNFF